MLVRGSSKTKLADLFGIWCQQNKSPVGSKASEWVMSNADLLH